MKGDIVDKNGRLIGSVVVKELGDKFVGSIDVANVPFDVLALCRDYEKKVNNQLFTLLDQIEEKLDSLELKFVGKTGKISDFQIMEEGKVSFLFVAVADRTDIVRDSQNDVV